MAAIDSFKTYKDNLTSPPENAVAVTPSDSTDLANVARVLYCTGAGNVTVDMHGTGTAIVLPMLVGIPLVGRFSRVDATGTTATGIVAMY